MGEHDDGAMAMSALALVFTGLVFVLLFIVALILDCRFDSVEDDIDDIHLEQTIEAGIEDRIE